MAEENDPYAVLGIAHQASEQEIKHRYREVVKQCHPDLGDEPERLAAFKRAVQAYAVLSDAGARATYDQENGLKSVGAGSESPGHTPPVPPVSEHDEAQRNRTRDVEEAIAAGRARLAAGEYQAAEDAGRLVLRWQRQNADAYVLVAGALAGLGRTVEARGCLYLALQIDPANRAARRALQQMQERRAA